MSEKVQLPLGFTPSASLGEADFVETEGNAEALAFLRQWPAWPSHALVLYGDKGSGKTHLAHIWAQKAGAVFIPSPVLDQGERLVLEDADRLMGHAEAEEALFHLLNHLSASKGSLLITANTPPALWPVKLPDLRSRLQALPTVHLDAPDDAALAALMAKLFADRQLLVGQDVIDYLVRRIERSSSAAHAAVAACDAAALATGRAVTLPLAREVLARITEAE